MLAVVLFFYIVQGCRVWLCPTSFYLKGLWTSRSMCNPFINSSPSPGWIPIVSPRRWKIKIICQSNDQTLLIRLPSQWRRNAIVSCKTRKHSCHSPDQKNLDRCFCGTGGFFTSTISFEPWGKKTIRTRHWMVISIKVISPRMHSDDLSQTLHKTST